MLNVDPLNIPPKQCFMWSVSNSVKMHGYWCTNQVINVRLISSILFHKEQKYVLIKCININKNEQNKGKAKMDMLYHRLFHTHIHSRNAVQFQSDIH